MIPAAFEFVQQKPLGPLSHAVESVWFARGASPHGRERILPSPAAVLLFVLGPPLRMTTVADGVVREVGGPWIEGPREGPLINEPTGETHVVGVTFVPGGLAAFQSASVALLANRLAPVAALDTRFEGATALAARLQVSREPHAAIALLADWLRAAMRPAVLEGVWQDAVLALADGLETRVSSIQESLGASRRHFIDQIRRRSGLTPKSLQRIARMRRLLEQIDARRPIRWSQEALGAGYFDQPHAIRDFRAFTGMTPTQYVERRRQAWGRDVEPGEAANFVPEIIR